MSSTRARYIKPGNVAVGDIIRVTTKQADVRRSIVGCVAEIHVDNVMGVNPRITCITRLGVILLAYYQDIGCTALVTLLGYSDDYRLRDLELDLYPEEETHVGT